MLKQPEIFSDENEAVLEIKKIINHEDYDPGQPGKERRGPYRGSDIAVYKVDGNKLALNKRELYPACLPRLSVAYEKEPGIFSGWVDPEPIHRINKRNKLGLSWAKLSCQLGSGWTMINICCLIFINKK